ncbi:MAG: tetratricopeptide repeat protein [Candidatus Omnitrophica bacterium]|nr:tetratricopeptide repeat protein [Candidatus Omnitrophota bacterium]MDD5238277.1 tetratricopeptide repeat protein [Candidatus Omnitrophota bacterium]
MFEKKAFLFLTLFLLLFYNFSYGEELIAKEAVDYYNQGVKAQNGGDLSEADTFYQKTLIVDPNNLDWQKLILNNRGIMYAERGDLKNAEIAFNEALKIDPNFSTAMLNLGLVYEMRRTRLESLEYWAQVFRLDEKKPKNFIIAVQEPAAKKKK